MVTTGISTMRMSATLLSEALGVEAMQATLGVDLHVGSWYSALKWRATLWGWWIFGWEEKTPGSTVQQFEKIHWLSENTFPETKIDPPLQKTVISEDHKPLVFLVLPRFFCTLLSYQKRHLLCQFLRSVEVFHKTSGNGWIIPHWASDFWESGRGN